MNTSEDAHVNDDEIALAVALAEARADNEVLAKQLALMTKDRKHGWDTAAASDKEYQKIYDRLVTVRELVAQLLIALDITTKLQPK